ncbi:MAG TPA: S41 family peptidase [Clostridiaceae bacterium]|nr:S41 family peptidase [Clostridiaceae bacterium]
MSIEDDTGSYAGIGATVQQKDGDIIVVSDLHPGGPAEEAGIKIGDVFEAINGEPIEEGTTPFELSLLIRGKPGTNVSITVYRPSEERSFDFDITRDIINQEIIRTKMLSDDIGYLWIDSFTNDLAPEFEDSMRDLIDQGAKKVVFDLRNNPGGSAQTVSDMLDFLLPKETLVSVEGRSDGEVYTEKWYSDSKMGVPEDMTYAILVNENSASASELFSGCLRDLGKAYLIGEKTYGKGTGTMLFPLNDGSAVNITVFQYFLPKGDAVEGIGITPDLEVELDPELEMLPIARIPEGEDNQLQEAINYLEEK